MASTTEAPDDILEETPDVVEVPEATEVEAHLTHVIMRPFHGGGLDRVIGEVVDGSTWRSAERLTNMRYLRVLEREDPTPVSDGFRFFIDDDALLAYIDQMPDDEITEEDEV